MFNHVSLGGKVTGKSSYTEKNGTQIYNGVIVVDDYYNGESHPCYVKFVVFGGRASVLRDKLTKGSDLVIHGKLSISEYEYQGKKYKEPVIKVKDIYLGSAIFNKQLEEDKEIEEANEIVQPSSINEDNNVAENEYSGFEGLTTVEEEESPFGDGLNPFGSGLSEAEPILGTSSIEKTPDGDALTEEMSFADMPNPFENGQNPFDM